jgi:RNA polymerase sigma factor (sigma-70 family)
MALRKRVGLEIACGTKAEVNEWHREPSGPADPTPERQLELSQSLERAARVAESLETRDQELLRVVAGDGLSERDAAQVVGVSRGSVAYRLRRARAALGRAWYGTTSWMRNAR